MTQPLLLQKHVSAAPKGATPDDSLSRDGARPPKLHQTMVGVGGLSQDFLLRSSASEPSAPRASAARALQHAAAPVRHFRPDRALGETVKFRPGSDVDARRPSGVAAPATAKSAPRAENPAAKSAPRASAAPLELGAATSGSSQSLEPPLPLESVAPDGGHTNLFRKAAVAARRADGIELDFSTGVKPRSWSLLLLLSSLVALLFVGAALAPIEVTAEAQGVLRSPNGLRPVASVLAGSITEVLVRGGEAVEPGQVLARLEATELRAALMNRLRELEIVREDVSRAAQHDQRIEAQSARAMQHRRAAIQARIELNAERLRQRRAHYQELDALAREGGASRAEAMNSKEAFQEASEVVSSLNNELALLELEISDRARQWQERESTRRTQLGRAEAGVDEARALIASTEIRSPASGRIESLLVAPGAVVPAGGVLGNIVPGGAPRTIVAFVPSREIAFVQVGAAATVEVASLPVSEFGLGKALVSRVSTDVATPAEVQGVLTETPKDSFVRVELQLVDSGASAKMDHLLRSGERVQVRLHRRERRLITLLFDFLQQWVQ